MATTTINQVKFSDTDVVNPDDLFGFNKNKVWVFHDHGFVLGVVLMPSLDDAIDELVDSGKLDHWMIPEDQVTFDEEDQTDRGPDGESLTRLGNAGEPFDIANLDVIEVSEPKMSLVALLENDRLNSG